MFYVVAYNVVVVDFYVVITGVDIHNGVDVLVKFFVDVLSVFNVDFVDFCVVVTDVDINIGVDVVVKIFDDVFNVVVFCSCCCWCF